MSRNGKVTATVGTAIALAGVIGFAAATAETRASATKQSESAAVTNDNGSVSRTFCESTVTTNGSTVTERRRETRTTTDTDGNLLESSTSEYAQSYPVGDTGVTPIAARVTGARGCESKGGDTESFLGLRFGSVFDATTNFVHDADEPTLLRAKFAPKKSLSGFDDYYVYVTPTTHKVVKVYACAREAIEPGARWRRHYLVEALEKRYQTWARLCSFCRPLYAFDIGGGRYVTACLSGATRDYETVLAAWDDALLTTAADETEAIREEARRSASERRERCVRDAADAF